MLDWEADIIWHWAVRLQIDRHLAWWSKAWLPTGLCKPSSSWSNRTHVKRPKNRWVRLGLASKVPGDTWSPPHFALPFWLGLLFFFFSFLFLLHHWAFGVWRNYPIFCQVCRIEKELPNSLQFHKQHMTMGTMSPIVKHRRLEKWNQGRHHSIGSFQVPGIHLLLRTRRGAAKDLPLTRPSQFSPSPCLSIIKLFPINLYISPDILIMINSSPSKNQGTLP